MEGGSCVAVLEESCEDRSGLFLWLEQRDHHEQPSAMMTASVIGDRLTHGRQVAGCWVIQSDN